MDYIIGKESDLVILFSGGADSVLLMEFAKRIKRNPIAVIIDYGQLHSQELTYAKNYCIDNNIAFKFIEIKGYNVKSGLTTGEKGLYEGVHQMNVPARNSIFISIAYGVAEEKGITEVWWGADYSDYEHKFPDCTQEYCGRMNSVLEIAGVKPIKLYAPLLGFTKEMVLTLLKEEYGITKEKIFSGYGEFE